LKYYLTIDKKSIIWNFKTWMEGIFGKKTFLENIRRETNAALSKVFDKVEEVSNVTALKLKISNFRSKIKDLKIEMGDFIVSNKKKFSDFPEIIGILDKIKMLEEQIDAKKEQINKLQKKDKNEAAVKKDESTSSL